MWPTTFNYSLSRLPLAKTLPPCPIPLGLRKYPVLWVANYKQKYRPVENEPKPSADMQPIRKKPLPTVNNQAKVRKPQVYQERITKTQEP